MEMEIQNSIQKLGLFQQIQVIKEIPFKQKIQKRGGYFVVSKKQFEIINYQQNQSQNDNQVCTKVLAQKKLSKRKRLNTIYRYQDKLTKQINLLQFFNGFSPQKASFFAKYYILNTKNMIKMQIQLIQRMQEQSLNQQSQKYYRSKCTNQTKQSEIQNSKVYQQALYMDYYEQSLQQYINNQGKLDIFQIIHLLKQIFKTVQLLHSIGIVHRDLKPGNFMLQKSDSGQLITKLIDYGQSTHISQEFSENIHLGFSLNYAPMQCTSSCREGFNAKQIDLWSVGVIIFKFLKNRFPLSYSKCFKGDIKASWPTQLNFCLVQITNHQASILQNLLIILSTLFIKVKPSERLNIKTGLHILQRIEHLINQIIFQ